MIFITSNRKLHLFDNFWTFKTQNTEYDHIVIENYIYKKLKETVEIYKNQTKNHSVLAKIYKVYIICTPKCDAFGNSFPSIARYAHRFALFGNVVNVLHDYQSIQVSFSS